jgi:hypothetical protein
VVGPDEYRLPAKKAKPKICALKVSSSMTSNIIYEMNEKDQSQKLEYIYVDYVYEKECCMGVVVCVYTILSIVVVRQVIFSTKNLMR